LFLLLFVSFPNQGYWLEDMTRQRVAIVNAHVNGNETPGCASKFCGAVEIALGTHRFQRALG